MENETTFDLNAAIGNWRAELAAQPGLTTDARRELETHLHDAIAGFQKRGLIEEESFWLACRRVGQPQHLGEEFARLNRAAVWREQVFWMAFGIMIFWQLTLTISYFEDVTLFHLTPGLHAFYERNWGLLACIPILLIGGLFARGWLERKSWIGWFLQNRFRLLGLMLLLTILCDLSQIASIRLDEHAAGHLLTVTWGAWFKTVFHMWLNYLQFSAAPLIFIFWFLPGAKPKTSQTSLIGPIPETCTGLLVPHPHIYRFHPRRPDGR